MIGPPPVDSHPGPPVGFLPTERSFGRTTRRRGRMESGARVHDARYESADAGAIRALQVGAAARAAALRVTRPTSSTGRAGTPPASTSSGSTRLEALAAIVPMVAKSDFVDDQLAHPPFGKRLERASGLGERLEIYTTSGTSGQGVEIHAQTGRELDEMVEMYRYLFRWAGLRPGDLAVLTLPLTMLGGGRIEWQGAVGSGLTVLPAGNIDAQAKLALIERFQPQGAVRLDVVLRAPPRGRRTHTAVPVDRGAADRARGRRLLLPRAAAGGLGRRDRRPVRVHAAARRLHVHVRARHRHGRRAPGCCTTSTRSSSPR